MIKDFTDEELRFIEKIMDTNRSYFIRKLDEEGNNPVVLPEYLDSYTMLKGINDKIELEWKERKKGVDNNESLV